MARAGAAAERGGQFAVVTHDRLGSSLVGERGL